MNEITEDSAIQLITAAFQNEFNIKQIMKMNDDYKKTLCYSKLLEGVLKAIPDVVGVYKPDHSILFYNHAGYAFYNKKPEEVRGKKCYEMLCREEKCIACPVEKAIETKEPLMVERFIPELNKYMECYYNPVCDDNGDILFIVEKLRDISKKKYLKTILKESEERYKQIVDLSPDAILITVDGEIVLANQAALKYNNHFIGESIYKHAPSFAKTIRKNLKQLLNNKNEKITFDYKFNHQDGNEIDLEVSSSYLNYKGKSGVIFIMRDVTKRKKELYAAARIQENLLQKHFPFCCKTKIESVYFPANIVSGDFFYVHKVDENMMIGILADVSGKGMTAALSVSALNVLFHEIVLFHQDPLQILEHLNKKIGNYLGESYIAACCFRFDFSINEAKIVGAGINQFIFHKNKQSCEEKIVKGSFLGMFENSIFEEQKIHFQSGDRFYFFTDGLDPIFTDDKIQKNYLEKIEISELHKYIEKFTHSIAADIDQVKDDCTLLALEIR